MKNKSEASSSSFFIYFPGFCYIYIMMEVNQNHKVEIYNLLINLRDLSNAFNQMVGSLYSGICADEINEILDTLNEKYGVKVSYYQMTPGRVQFNNLDSLIKEYQLWETYWKDWLVGLPGKTGNTMPGVGETMNFISIYGN